MANVRLQGGDRLKRCGVLLWALLTLSLAASPALAADANRPNKATASITLDVLSLLTSEQIFPAQAEDGVWIIKPGSGRKLFQLPLLIEAGKEDTDFNSTIVRVRGARINAWRTVDPESQKAESGSDAARAIEASLMDMPTFTRTFTLTANGRVKWRMDRVLIGGELKTINLAAGTPERLYPLRISPQLLSDAMPKQPRLVRNPGENSMDYYARTALANNDFLLAREKYMQLREQVAALDDHFDIAAPRRVWGVYDMLIFERQLEISGTDEASWRMPQDVLDRLRAASRAALLPDGKPDSGHVAAMMLAAQDPHPYSQRLVAYTLSLSGITGSVTPNDQLYQLLSHMLQSPDAQAKRIVIKEIATVMPPSTATLTLLKTVAKDDLDPRSRLETLKGMLSTDFTQPSQQTRDAMASIQQALNDPQGPTPAQVLDEVLASSKDRPAAVSMLASGIRFAEVPDSRLHQVIVYVVENAGTHPLAAQWLDQQFLGAIDSRVVLRTLEIIAAADAGGQSLTPAVSTGLSRLFGAPRQQPAQGGDQGDRGHATARLTSPILIETVNHSIFRALRSSDPKIRQLAWQALPNFVFSPSQATDPAAPDPGRGRYEALLDIALQQNPTPVGVANFLLHQPQRYEAAAMLVQLILRGSTEAGATASRNLLTMKTPLDQVLLALSFGERAGLASRLYENTIGPAPLAVNLLRQRNTNNPLVVWFAQQVSQGHLPTRQEWSMVISNEAALIELISSSDPDVGAAAVAALAYRVGGKDKDVPALTRTLRHLPDQSASNLAAEWQRMKRNLLMSQFQEIIGPYQLILRLDNKDYTLGIVQFQSDGQSISFGNQAINLSIPEDRLAIRLDTPGQLKSFSQQPELVNLPLDDLTAIELTPQPNGDWIGQIVIPNAQQTPQLIMRSMFGN